MFNAIPAEELDLDDLLLLRNAVSRYEAELTSEQSQRLRRLRDQLEVAITRTNRVRLPRVFF